MMVQPTACVILVGTANLRKIPDVVLLSYAMLYYTIL